jgi:sec-independent protein translocase protein TatB
MFGLTFEKLLVVAIVAGVLVGPQRLPHYAHELARLVRSFRAFVETTRAQAERDMGVPLQPAQWDLAQYDPRRIVREAMQEPAAPMTSEAWAEIVEQAARVRPGQKHVVTGSAAHPRRVLIASLPMDDPRRVAAEVLDATA